MSLAELCSRTIADHLARIAQARMPGAYTVGFSAGDVGALAEVADELLLIAHHQAARVQEGYIQEGHILSGNLLCDWVEQAWCEQARGLTYELATAETAAQ